MGDVCAVGTALAVVLCVLTCSPDIHAQTFVSPETGHYQAGFGGGLKSGMLAPPGTYVSNGTMIYFGNRLKGPNGNSVPGFTRLDIIANRTSFLWVSNLKLMGAYYAAAIAFPIANLAPNYIGVGLDPAVGLGDMYFQPMTLGWHWPNFHLMTAVGFFAPTGRYTTGGASNTGKGFWTLMFTLGGAWTSSDEKPWHASLLSRYEVHSEKKDVKVTPGNTLSLELGVGKRITKALDLGLVGLGIFQTTDVNGQASTRTAKYRVFGAGAEMQYAIPKIRLSLKLRAFYEFAAVNFTEGILIVPEIVYKF